MKRLIIALTALLVLAAAGAAFAADVVLTSVGQSPDVMMVRVVLRKMKIDADSEPLLKADALAGRKVLVAVVGGSSKGLGAAGINKDQEVVRVSSLLKAAKEKPKTIKLATTGTGGIPFVLASMFKSMKGAEFNMVGFDGDGSGITALLGGHVDAMPISMMGAGTVDLIKTGKLRALAIIHDKRVSQLPNVPAITEIYPEFKKKLPIGHYYGVFVKKGTPQPIVDTLRKAYMTAVKDPQFTDFIKRVNAIPLALTGEEAKKFIRKNQANVSWVLEDAGVTKVSPEKLGIPRP